MNSNDPKFPLALPARLVAFAYSALWVVAIFGMILPLLLLGHILRTAGEFLIWLAYGSLDALDDGGRRLADFLT